MQWIKYGQYLKIDNEFIKEIVEQMQDEGLNVEEV